MIIYGGADASSAVTDSLQIYELNNNTFKTLPAHGTPRKAMSAIQYYDATKQSHKIIYYGGGTSTNAVTNVMDIFTIPRSSKRD